MAKKPGTGQVTATQGDELHLGLHLHYDDSDEDFGDSDPGDFSGSDDSFESDVTLEDIAGDSLDIPKVQVKAKNLPKDKIENAAVSNGNSMALVPTEGAANDPYDVPSDEEQDLLKGIKDEIRNMVREEMQSELQVYEHKVKAIEAGRLPSADGGAAKEDNKYPDLENMEPELREAFIKMRKLDRVLEKKIKKEKEVKRDRILLERRIREEIGSMQANGKVQRDIKANTDKYLALALPPSHNQGVIVDEPPVTPLFQTQVNEQDLKERQHRGSEASPGRGSRQESAASSRSAGSAATVNRDGNEQKPRKHGRHRKKKDFIKRNKELAANANDMIAMTDDEKKRLQELLTDVDALPEIPEEGLEGLNFSEDNNPFQIAIHPGEGFMPNDNELRSLTAIDQKLQTIMPPEEFRSIASSALSHVPQKRLFTRTGIRCEADFEAYGEKALMETKDDREMTTKLKDIEEQLTMFQNRERNQPDTTALSEEQLENLLDDCIRSMSALSLPQDTPESIDSDRTLESARTHLLVNPPRLTDEMLQKLLSEAHFPLSSHLMALQDDDSKSEHGGSDGVGAIRAETWKAIAEETLSEEEEEGDMSSPGDQQQGSLPPHPTKQSVIFPRPSASDTNIHPMLSRRPPLRRYSSQTSESDGRDSRVSLPEISSSPLINTAQGGGIGASNNDPMLYYSGRSEVRNGSSLDMVYNDLSMESPHSRVSSSNQRLAGTPLTVEEVENQEQATPTPPTPHPPSSERSTNRRSLKSISDSIDKDQKS